MSLTVTSCPSPNRGPRRDGLTPTLIVIHHTAMQTSVDACARLCDPASEVSAHYLVDEVGAIIRMVDEPDRAWHAGAGEWHGLSDINSRSIGIELANRGTHPFSEPQMAALEALLRDIMARHAIPADGVIGHSDMAPGRKSDPGPHFDWARLARQGLAGSGTPPEPGLPLTEAAFRACAAHAGFTANAPFDVLLSATRLRFAPWRTGALVREDLALCH